MAFLARLFSTGFGVGYFPFGPGTMGALAILIIYWVIPPIDLIYFIVGTFTITILGIISSTITEKESIQKFGSDGGHDPGIIVIDEIVGMLVTLIAVPKTLFFLIAGFFLFRFFDIVKIFPIKKFEELPSGLGIICDDIMAGIYANIILQIIRYFWMSI